MSWWEDFFIAAGSIADDDKKNIDKRKQTINKSLRKVQKTKKGLSKDIKKLNSDYNRAIRKGSIGNMNKAVSELEKISKTHGNTKKKWW